MSLLFPLVDRMVQEPEAICFLCLQSKRETEGHTQVEPGNPRMWNAVHRETAAVARSSLEGRLPGKSKGVLISLLGSEQWEQYLILTTEQRG